MTTDRGTLHTAADVIRRWTGEPGNPTAEQLDSLADHGVEPIARITHAAAHPAGNPHDCPCGNEAQAAATCTPGCIIASPHVACLVPTNDEHKQGNDQAGSINQEAPQNDHLSATGHGGHRVLSGERLAELRHAAWEGATGAPYSAAWHLFHSQWIAGTAVQVVDELLEARRSVAELPIARDDGVGRLRDQIEKQSKTVDMQRAQLRELPQLREWLGGQQRRADALEVKCRELGEDATAAYARANANAERAERAEAEVARLAAGHIDLAETVAGLEGALRGSATARLAGEQKLAATQTDRDFWRKVAGNREEHERETQRRLAEVQAQLSTARAQIADLASHFPAQRVLHAPGLDERIARRIADQQTAEHGPCTLGSGPTYWIDATRRVLAALKAGVR